MQDDPLFFKDRAAWRRWLQKNHNSRSEIWILAFKRHTKTECISYEEALEEAICFGWIDCRLRRIDDEKHLWRFAPRRADSIWSLNNRRRTERLIREGKMTAHGLRTVEEGKRSGQWQKAIAPSKPPRMPDDLKKALVEDKVAWTNFQKFAKSYRTTYIYWISSAKREETRRKRIAEVVRRSRDNKKPFVP